MNASRSLRIFTSMRWWSGQTTESRPASYTASRVFRGITVGEGWLPKRMLGRSSQHQATRNDFESSAMVHLDSLYATGLRMTRDPRDAEDLVQDTMLAAYRFFHRFE